MESPSRRREQRRSRETQISPRRKEVIFKFLVIGDFGVGKTAIVRRYVEGKFTSNYKITIGADFSLKTIQWDANTRVSVQLWDIAGHERFNYMTRVYYKYAVGCAIVFDVTRQSTFASVKRDWTEYQRAGTRGLDGDKVHYVTVLQEHGSTWLKDVRDKVVLDDGKDIPVILLANKSDIEEHSMKASVISRYCKEEGILNWFFTSAKTNVNISEAMLALVEAALEMQKPAEVKQEEEEVVHLQEPRVYPRYEEEPCCR